MLKTISRKWEDKPQDGKKIFAKTHLKEDSY